MNPSQSNERPLFCIDITFDKKNEAVNGVEFIVRTASESQMQKIQGNQSDLDKTIEKSKPPLRSDAFGRCEICTAVMKRK